MAYLLDTNTCVYAIKRRPEVLNRLAAQSPDEVLVSAITVAELWFGARKSSRPQATRKAVDAFLKPFEVVAFDAEAAEHYATVRLILERAGQPIGERDLLIASSALAAGLAVVTHNVREFTRVPTLRVEDWYSPLP